MPDGRTGLRPLTVGCRLGKVTHALGGIANSSDRKDQLGVPGVGLELAAQSGDIDVHHPQVEKALLEQVLVKFYWLREQKELRKRPSTSELIDWITALLRAGVNPAQLEAELPFMGALLKNEQDTKVISQYLDRDGKLPTSLDELKGPGRR